MLSQRTKAKETKWYNSTTTVTRTHTQKHEVDPQDRKKMKYMYHFWY